MNAKVKVVERDNPDIGILEEAASLILKGEVLVCPTDTCYIFVVDALNTTAVKKVFALKKRSFDNPIHVAVSEIGKVEKYAYMNEVAKILASKFLPGALTLVLPGRKIIPPVLTGGRDSIGIRIPDNQTVLRLAHMVDRPLTVTSANISGKATPYTVTEIITQLEDSIQQVALVLDEGILSPIGTSTIVDLSISPAKIIRQGRISEQDIFSVLQSN